MTVTKDSEQLLRPSTELEELADYYDSHDTNAEMEHGEGASHSRWHPSTLRTQAMLRSPTCWVMK
jgi:hypothetical protein